MSRISSQLRFNDLTGGINNVYDKEMINSSTKKTESPDMVNVEYFKLGGIKTMNGNSLVGTTKFSIQENPVVGGWEYTKGNRRYMIIGLENGDVRLYDQSLDIPDSENNPFKLIYKFPSSSKRMSFCNMNNGVVVTNGVDDLLFYELNRTTYVSGVISTSVDVVYGSSTKFGTEIKVGDGINVNGNTYYVKKIIDEEELIVDREFDADDYVTDYKLKLADTSLCNATFVNTDPDKDVGGKVNVKIRGLAIQFYNGRLWVGGKEGLFYSAVGLPNNWDARSDAGAIYDLYNDSSEVTALGLFSEYLMVHKKYNTYILTMEGEGSTLQIKPFSNITCNSQQSWIVSNTKYFVYSDDFMDIYPLVQHTVFNDKFLGEPITQKVRNIFKKIRVGDTENIFCVSRPLERQMIFYLPTTERSGSGEALIYDFQTKSFLLRRLPKETTVNIAFNFDNNVYIGTEDGMILKEFSSNSFTTNETKKYEKTVPIIKHRSLGRVRCGFMTNTYNPDDPYNPNDKLFDMTFTYFGGVLCHTGDIILENNTTVEEFVGYLNDNKCDLYDKTNGDLLEYRISNISDLEFISESHDGSLYLYEYYANIVLEKDDTEVIEVEYKAPKNIQIEAYYKSPWFDWSGNYMQSFSEFFLECDSDYKNKFIIRTQKDGTSRYEDRYINEDKFIEKQNILVWDSEEKEWDKDRWAKITFDTLRMLLPNSVFESFQLEFRTDTDNEEESDKLNRGFHIYQYGFRRIETEEAPW